MSAWMVYAWSQADTFRSVAGVFSIVTLIFVTMFGFFMHSDGAAIPRWFRTAGIAAAIIGLAALVAPSSRTIALMYVLPRAAESDVIQRDVPELYNLAIDALRSELSEKVGK